MTQNNIYMEDENLVIYVDVLPEMEDIIINSSSSALASAESASESAVASANLLESIRNIKTGVELFVAQAINNLHDLYTNLSAQLNLLKDTIIDNINTRFNTALRLIQQAETSVLSIIQTSGSGYVNEARSYARAAQEIVDFHVSTEHLNQSKGLLTGEMSDDYTVLNSVKSYAHSTFDLSKFTVVGSPIITNDGIASGFSTSNYLTKSISVTSNNYIISALAKPDGTDSNAIWGFSHSNTNDLRLQLQSGAVLLVTGSTTILINKSVSWDTTKFYLITVSYNGEKYVLKVYQDGVLITSGEYASETNLLASSTTLIIGNDKVGNYYKGSIDLKQFSTAVDGVETFSGNKTGIDTIKPDDYTVVGTPVITAGGIASGFSASNYLTKSISITSDNYIISALAKPDGTNSNIVWQFLHSTTNDMRLQVQSNSLLLVSGTSILINKSISWDTTKFYVINVSYNGSQYTLDVYQNETLITSGNYMSETNLLASATILMIGNDKDGNYYKSLIDLNSFKIYINGDLEYQPCLKIPYAESKTGSKVVDSVYRDRVNDMAEQFGYAPYYTLSDTDFTLPAGEIYGMLQRLQKQIDDLNS